LQWIFQDFSSGLGIWLLLGVILQEALRFFLFFRAYDRAEAAFSIVATNGVLFPLSDFSSSLAAGLGWGTVEAIILHGSTIVAAIGPGTLATDQCPMSAFTLSGTTIVAFFCTLALLMNVCLNKCMRACIYVCM
jgi:hypothetical protein